MGGKVPVTVATGFLGSGKTTLINHILTANHGKRIAVIENEFGEISIDSDLVNQRLGTTEEIFELNNGCICCKVRGDLIRILSKLVRRKSRLEHIIIETTGLANPGPVIQTFFADDTLRDQLDLDAILTVVDGKHCLQHIQRDHSSDVKGTSEAVQQIAFADRILLNKTDLLSDKEKANVTRLLKGINSQASILECSLTSGPPDLESLLNLGAFDLDRLTSIDPALLLNDDEREESREGLPEHSESCTEEDCNHPGHSHHSHVPGVSSVAIEIEGQLNPKATNAWLGELLQERGSDLYRSKGILCFAGDEDRTVFQGVHNMWQFSKLEGTSSKETSNKPLNKLVFIGLNLDRENLRASVEACLLRM